MRLYKNTHTMTTTITATTTTDLRTRYQQARARYEADPANLNHARTLGWVYADLLKDASGQADTARMVRGLALIANFEMVDDLRWRESVLWSVCRFLLRHTPKTLPLGALAEVVHLSQEFLPANPSLVRSVWWKAILRHNETGVDWLGLIGWLGWEGMFRPDDEEPQPFGEGKTSKPLLEGLVQVVAKQLLQLVVLPDELAAPWLMRLTDLTARHPDWDFLPYYHAQLLQKLNRPDEAMRVFLPFARRKQADFWVWSLLAELVDPADQLACYARALSQKTPETFLVKVRQRAAGWLIATDRWAEARAEIDRLTETRRVSQWPIPIEVQRWTNDDRYTQAEILPVGSWYKPLLPRADALLWADLPETVALVTEVDADKRVITVAIDPQTTAQIRADRFGLRVAVGNRVAVRYVRREKNGRQQVQIQTAVSTDEPLTSLKIRQVPGPLRMVAGKTVFGFVGGVYVPAGLLAGNAGLADALVRVEAVEAWDAVKQKTGWRAFRIQKEGVTLGGREGADV